MTVATYEQLALGWRPDSRQDYKFNLIAVLALICSIIAGYIVTNIIVPKEPREARITVPERVAKFITAKPKPKEIIKPKPKPVVPLPKPRFERKKLQDKKPLTKIEKKARKKAEESGLLALTKELSDLVDTSTLDNMVGSKINRKSGQSDAAKANTEILTANSGKGSSGVSQNTRGGSVSGARLDDNQRQLARKLLASKGRITDAHSKSNDNSSSKRRGSNLRSEEDVAYVMDKHKSMLHALYRRALRKNPGLKGKIVLEITILPSGKVSKVSIKSSELRDSKLEASLLARVRQFNFGVSKVKTLTVTVPVEFLPS